MARQLSVLTVYTFCDGMGDPSLSSPTYKQELTLTAEFNSAAWANRLAVSSFWQAYSICNGSLASAFGTSSGLHA